MINLNCTKMKRLITLVLLMLTVGAVLYPAQARREVEQIDVNDPNAQSTQATGFAWEIHARPENDAIVVTKDMWLVNQSEQKIPNTTYTYNIDCEMHVGLDGGDVAVDGNVINFTGGYLECQEDIPAHMADFQQRIADWGTITCTTSCTISTEDLYISAVLRPDGPTGQLLNYPAINNGDFFVVAGQGRLGWGLPVTSAASRGTLSSSKSSISFSDMVFADIDWGDKLKRLTMHPYCPTTGATNPCEIRYNLGGIGDSLDTGYATTYSYAIQENTFYIGQGGWWKNSLFTNFLGDVRYLRWDPPSCFGCFHPN